MPQQYVLHKKTIHYHGNYLVVCMTFLFFICSFIAQLCNILIYHYPLEPTLFILIFSMITTCLFFSYFKFRKQSPYCTFTSNYLLSTFTLLISWRISVLLNMHWVSPFMLTAFTFKVLNYCLCAYFDLREQKNSAVDVSIHNTRFEWQLFFLRMLVGFIFVPHFTQKLFAGPALRMELLASFKHLGLSHPLVYVYLAGMMEFAGCLAMGCGFLTRLGAICSTVYLITATYLGNHFSAGFIWVSDGGGWEYPMLWSILVLSFACFGSDSFSLDRVIKETCKVPKWIKCLMG